MARKKKEKKIAILVPSPTDVTNISLHDKPSIIKPFSQWIERIEEEEALEYQRIIKKYGSEENYYRALWNEYYGIKNSKDQQLPFEFDDDDDDNHYPYDFNDDYYDEDFVEEYNQRKGKNKKKRGKNAKKHDKVYDDYNVDEAYKRICFYTNYDDEATMIEFDSIKEFDDYCTEMNYEVNQSDAMDIVYCDEYHCALSPYEMKRFEKSLIIGGETYDDLHYRCQELEYYANLDEESEDSSFSTVW